LVANGCQLFRIVPEWLRTQQGAPTTHQRAPRRSAEVPQMLNVAVFASGCQLPRLVPECVRMQQNHPERIGKHPDTPQKLPRGAPDVSQRSLKGSQVGERNLKRVPALANGASACQRVPIPQNCAECLRTEQGIPRTHQGTPRRSPEVPQRRPTRAPEVPQRFPGWGARFAMGGSGCQRCQRLPTGANFSELQQNVSERSREHPERTREHPDAAQKLSRSAPDAPRGRPEDPRLWGSQMCVEQKPPGSGYY
jgi:hypothetical protein